MLITKIARLTLVAAIAGASLTAMADGYPEMKEMLTMKGMDANKDGMVSRDEFVAMMGKLYDMKAKEMGAKDGKINAQQYVDLQRAIVQLIGGGH